MSSRFSMVIFGGGDAGHTALEFATEGIRLAKLRRPASELKLVIIPTARFSAQSYDRAVRWAIETFEELGAECRVLTPFVAPPPADAADMLAEADAIYMPGGSTIQALKYWDQYNLTRPIVEAVQRGVTVIGISAGIVAWFEYMFTGSALFLAKPGEPWDYEIAPALGILPGCCCPHAGDDVFSDNHQPRYEGTSTTRRELFQAQLKSHPIRMNGVAVDGFTALRITGDTVTVLGLGLVTLHLWENDKLKITQFRAGDGFNLTTLSG